MDIKWKDGKGSILNANKNRIIYLDVETNIKIVIKNEEIKKITIVDGMMNLFRDFENDLILTAIIPKKHKRNAVKIYNEYDKTGKRYKGKTGNMLIDIFLESSFSNPIFGLSGVAFLLLILIRFVQVAIGEEVIIILRIALIGYILYSIFKYILTTIKRKKLKQT